MVRNMDMRHPRERTDLLFALLIASALFGIISIFTWGLCCLWGAIGLLVMALLVAVENSHQRNVSRRVTDESDPDLHSRAERAANELGIAVPEIYIAPSRDLNAYTRGVMSPLLVLNSGILEAMDPDEVSFVLGHEMGHIRLRHFAIRTILGASGVRIPLVLYLPLLVFRYLFLNGRLSRSMEYSADRAGLHVCGSLETAVSTMIKLGTGRKVDKDQVEDAIEGRFQIDGRPSLLSALLSTHPDLDDRVRQLVHHSRSGGHPPPL